MKFTFALVLFFLSVGLASAEPRASILARQANLSEANSINDRSPSIVIRGRENSSVVQDIIRLSDIADISSPSVRDDEAIIALKKIVLSEAPKPGFDTTISAQQVLSSLRMAGVDLTKVGYLFPKIMKVERASRTIGSDEVTRALVSYLEKVGREAEVQQVVLRGNVKASPRADHIEILPLAASRGPLQAFQVQVQEDGRTVNTFDIQAAIKEWSEVPVARRGLTRGETIAGTDVVMARVNSSNLAGDVIRSAKDVVGLKTSAEIAAGDIFRRNRLSIPPLVQSGERLSILYKSRLLEASARGIALDSGAEGDNIRVRNESSKKILSGIVTALGLVEVRQ